MDDFLEEFFPKIYKRKQAHLHETDYCKYYNQLLTPFTSSLYFAGLVSTFGASYVTRKKGRRTSILVGAVSIFLGGVINAAAVNIGMLIYWPDSSRRQHWIWKSSSSIVPFRDGSGQALRSREPAFPIHNLHGNPYSKLD
ncbi:sugar transport protein 14-like [Hibiscus syriacus]|uniref:sugar transport protein 14-like n=1 Tax=Hibiscus syriacus TaxID=106335 RepID=UPI0019243372|nr:sugar transport protein 14-like [Hibiscus syriacus]